MSGTIGISCTTQSRQKNENLYFKAVDVLETTYNSVKLSYSTNLDAPTVKNLKEYQPRFTYTAGPFYITCKSDMDFVYDLNLLTINTSCTEIEISNKDVNTPTACVIEVLDGFSGKIILDGVNIQTTSEAALVLAKGSSSGLGYTNIHIKENTTNTLSGTSYGIKVDSRRSHTGTSSEYYENLVITGDNNENAILNIRGNIGIKGNPSNVEIRSGRINCDKIYCSLSYFRITGGKTELLCNKLGDQSWEAGNLDVLGGVTYFEDRLPLGGKYSEEDANKAISGSPVVFQVNDNSICSQLENNNSGMFISGSSVNFGDYSKDSNGNIVINNDVVYEGVDYQSHTFIGKDSTAKFKSIELNNGTITNNGTMEVNNLTGSGSIENNGKIIVNGDIAQTLSITGSGRIINNYDITVEVNGELYSDITVDKVNKTITINNLTPETNYDINLIASFEPYVERSKTIKQKTLEAPNCLISGPEFNKILKELIEYKIYLGPFNENYPSLLFDIKPDTYTDEYVNKNFVYKYDISEKKNQSIMMYAKEFDCKVIEIRSKNKILFNEDSSNMFKDIKLKCNWESGKGTFGLTFNNIDTSNVKNMKNMFYGFTLEKGDESGNVTYLNLDNINTSNAINIDSMLSNVYVNNITNFVIRNVPNSFNNVFYGTGPKDESQIIVIGWTNKETKTIANQIYNSMSSYNQIYFEVSASPST